MARAPGTASGRATIGAGLAAALVTALGAAAPAGATEPDRTLVGEQLLMRAQEVADPAVRTTRLGLTVAAWTAYVPARFTDEIHAAVADSDGSGWSEPVMVGGRGGPGGIGPIAVEHRGRPMLFWRSYEPATISTARLRPDGSWTRERHLFPRQPTSPRLEVASDGRDRLAVFYQGPDQRERVAYRDRDSGGWVDAPALPDTGRRSDLAVGSGRIFWAAEIPDLDSGTAAVVVSWSPGEPDWTVDRVGPEPGRHWREEGDFAPIYLHSARSGALAVTWPDVGEDETIQLQIAYRGPSDEEFGAPHAEPGLQHWPQVSIHADGTVVAVGRPSDADSGEALLVERDPVDGTWGEPRPVVDGRVDIHVSRVVTGQSGWAVVEIWAYGDDPERIQLVPCQVRRGCGDPAAFVPARKDRGAVLAVGDGGSATRLSMRGNGCEECVAREIWVREIAAPGTG